MLGDADGAAVTEPEVGVDVHARGDRQDAAGRQNAIALNNDGAVVQRGVLEEEGLQEGRRGVGIDALAGVDDFLQVVGALENNQGPCLALRHVHAGLYVGVEIGAGFLAGIVAPETEPLDERVAGKAGLGAYKEQELAYLGLEDDDQRDESDADDATKDLTAEPHVEQGKETPGDVDDQDGPEDAHDVGAAYQPIEPVDEGGDHKNVENVDEPDGRKGHGICFFEI